MGVLHQQGLGYGFTSRLNYAGAFQVRLAVSSSQISLWGTHDLLTAGMRHAVKFTTRHMLCIVAEGHEGEVQLPHTTLQISQECLTMMGKIFVGNPAYRVSIRGIKSHPWFTQNLPDKLKVCTWLHHLVLVILKDIVAVPVYTAMPAKDCACSVDTSVTGMLAHSTNVWMQIGLIQLAQSK